TADQSQRINVLRFRCDGGRVTVTAPERPEVCPPGHYMLFALSKAGVPSVARIVRISKAV
ncbi:MAG: galactose oxidase early set domain-containing protein, partial [Pseudonocardiaceae bacterium]